MMFLLSDSKTVSVVKQAFSFVCIIQLKNPNKHHPPSLRECLVMSLICLCHGLRGWYQQRLPEPEIT